VVPEPDVVPVLAVVPLEVSPAELDAPADVELVEAEVVEPAAPLEALVPAPLEEVCVDPLVLLPLVISWLPPLLQAQMPNNETTAMGKAMRISGSLMVRRDCTPTSQRTTRMAPWMSPLGQAPESYDPNTAPRHPILAGFEAGQRGQLRRMLAEAIGTFALTTVDAGAAMVASLDARVTLTARSAAAGLIVVSMCYALGNVSGAHLNPSVTLAFALRRALPWRFVPGYWFAQTAGAVLAAAILWAILGPIAHLGASAPLVGTSSAVAMEALLTFFLITVILSTATQYKVLAPTAPLASGAAVAFCGLLGRAVSGASMNPARSLGPALVDGSLSGYWIYLVGPMAGAVVATLAVSLVHPRHHREEREAAAGR
jgi:MIP family channel proteins